MERHRKNKEERKNEGPDGSSNEEENWNEKNRRERER